MQYTKDGLQYLIVLEIDEDVHQSLLEFARAENLKAGFISGIGALKQAELGFYHLDRQQYDRKMFSHEMELLALEGNLSFYNGAPFVHLHTVLGLTDFSVVGGHLFSAKVAVTCEIHFRVFDKNVTRIPNASIGLNLLRCPN